jgi:dTDP-4-amino-4,6-dideoxygalactose transaminase
MHESTVSRVTSNKYVSTPRGVFELKFFFTASINATGDGAAHSAEAVRHRIKSMIDHEGRDGDVLSDDRIVELLNEAGIDTGLHYPTALPYLEVFADAGYKPSDFPVAHAQMDKILSLPMYAELTEEMIEKVCRSLKNALAMSAAN